MAKSMRSKKLKRLRAIRREMVEPLYEQRDAAKYAAQEAALAAHKLPVRNNTSMDTTSSSLPPSNSAMDVDMADRSLGMRHLKPAGKKMKKKLKMGKRGGKGKGKGKIRRKHI